MANNYLADALHLRSRGSRTSSYLLFQAAELLILAVIAAESIQPSRDIQHQLAALIDLLPSDNYVKHLLKEVESLTAYATTYRYVTPSGRIPPDATDADFTDMSNRIERLILGLAKWFKVADLALSADDPAGNIRPPRSPAPKPPSAAGQPKP